MVVLPRLAGRHVDLQHAGVGGQADARPAPRLVGRQVALEKHFADPVPGKPGAEPVEQFAEGGLEQRRQEYPLGAVAQFDGQGAPERFGRELVQGQAQAGGAFGVEQQEVSCGGREVSSVR